MVSQAFAMMLHQKILSLVLALGRAEIYLFGGKSNPQTGGGAALGEDIPVQHSGNLVSCLAGTLFK